MNRSLLRWWIGAVTVLVLAMGTQPGGQAPAGQPAGAGPRPPQDLLVLSPKAKSAGWTGVHKPHTKLADVLAKHKGQADWAETVVDDESLFAQWVSMAPGGRGLPRGARTRDDQQQRRNDPQPSHLTLLRAGQ